MAASMKTLAYLTNDDSKILGRSLKMRSSLQNTGQQQLQLNKLTTLNSNWTPLVNKTANRTVTNTI